MNRREKCFICDRWVSTEHLTEGDFNGSIEKICLSCLRHLQQEDTQQAVLLKEEQAKEKALRQRIPEVSHEKSDKQSNQSNPNTGT